MSLFIKDILYLPMTGSPQLKRGSIRIDGQRITALGDLSPKWGDEIIYGQDKIALPGFVNGHCHAAMSMLVCYGVHSGKAAPTIFAFVMHACMDSVASISQMIGRGLTLAQGYTMIYILLMAFAVLAILILKNIRARWAAEEAQEVPYDSQA